MCRIFSCVIWKLSEQNSTENSDNNWVLSLKSLGCICRRIWTDTKKDFFFFSSFYTMPQLYGIEFCGYRCGSFRCWRDYLNCVRILSVCLQCFDISFHFTSVYHLLYGSVVKSLGWFGFDWFSLKSCQVHCIRTVWFSNTLTATVYPVALCNTSLQW